MSSYINNPIVNYLKSKISNMSPTDMLKYAKQCYELYNFLKNARNNDTTINDFFNNNNINKDDLLQNLNKENVIAIYNSLSDDQKQQMKQFTSLIQILLNDPKFDFDNPDNNTIGGKTRKSRKRRQSKRRRSKKRKSKRRSSKRRISRK
jgi:hypothetical protein